jgi:Putative Ig domain
LTSASYSDGTVLAYAYDAASNRTQAGTAGTLSITTSSLPTPLISVAYSQSVATSGGIAPIGFSISSGSLPAGLAIASSTGNISGTPTTAGAYSFTVLVTDALVGGGAGGPLGMPGAAPGGGGGMGIPNFPSCLARGAGGGGEVIFSYQ